MKLLVLPVLVTVWLLSHTTQAKSPILIIHGITGSALFVRDDRETSFLRFFTRPHECNTGGRFRRAWVDLFRLLGCGNYELSLDYDPATNQFNDRPQVEVRAPEFGSMEAIDGLGLLDPLETLVNHFTRLGYESGKNIRDAPYDWRLAGSDLERRGYFDNLRKEIETMYRDNGNRKVTMVVHSMGGLVSHYFLTRYSGINQAWKDKHIHAYVPLSGAWSGGVGAVASIISGLHFGDGGNVLNELFADFLVPIGQTLASIPWLFPRASVFGDTVVVRTPNRDYTAADYEDLFRQIGYTNGYNFHLLATTADPEFPAPNVPTHCLYGVGVDTPETFVYDSLENQPTQVIPGDGDGTVNLLSSEVCLKWRSMRDHSFTDKQFEGVDHLGMVTDVRVLRYIESVVGVSQRFVGMSQRFRNRLFNRRRFRQA